jgi:surface antigen
MSQCKYVLLISAALMAGCAQVNNEDIGMVTGGVVGGLLGSQFGGGAGKVAAAAGGAFIGTMIGGRIGKYMDRQDKLEVERALETAPTGREVSWNNPDSGYHYHVTPTRTYYVDKAPCREYVTQAEINGKIEKIHGKACRQPNGTWRVAS